MSYQLLSSTRYDALLLTLGWNNGGTDNDNVPSCFLLLKYHYHRLRDAAEKHGWDIAAGSISYEGLKEECIRAVEEAGTGTSYRIRITLSETGLVAVTASPVPPLTADPSSASLVHSSTAHVSLSLTLDIQPISSSIFTRTKTTRREHYDNARQRAGLTSYADPADVLLFNEKDEITETSIANVAFWRDEGWVTPDASTGCLTGVFRRWLLEKGRIKEGIVMKGEIKDEEVVLVFNGVKGCLLGLTLRSSCSALALSSFLSSRPPRMLCSKAVFRCFKALERFGDRITGAAGPYFVGFAVVLLSTGLICFLDVIMPNLPYSLITTPICILIALNLFMHYYYVVTIPPGFVEDPPREAGSNLLWANPRIKKTHRSSTEGVRWSSELNITRASTTRCRKCGQMKPERTHHCRICNRCVLKYDHHCPWINQCVGLHNERHFVMFMGYLCLAALTFCILGYDEFFHALGLFQDEWQYHVPVLAFILIFVLAGVLFFAVGVMFAFHIHSVMKGETSVEHHDNEHYRKVALSRAETFVNSYNLGRRKNLKLFFNVGENGYPLYTLFFPFRILPYTDGRSWARRSGFDRHHGVRQGEELTDDDEEWD